jgi:hypothetical protein
MGWLCDLFSVLRVYVCEYIFVCGYALVGFAVMYVVDVCTQVCLCSNSFLSLSLALAWMRWTGQLPSISLFPAFLFPLQMIRLIFTDYICSILP